MADVVAGCARKMSERESHLECTSQVQQDHQVLFDCKVPTKREFTGGRKLWTDLRGKWLS